MNRVAGRRWPERAIFKVVSCQMYPVLMGEYPYYVPEQLVELAKAREVQARQAKDAGAAVLRNTRAR